jgi:ABC-type transporter Mla subunit MlaD
MADTHKLDEAFDRFESALRQFEAALARRAGSLRESETLASELDQVKVKASELVDNNRKAVGRIDAAMSRIRSVLHSNSGA